MSVAAAATTNPAAPAEHRGPDDRDDEQRRREPPRDVVVQGGEHGCQEDTGRDPADDRGPAMEAFEAGPHAEKRAIRAAAETGPERESESRKFSDTRSVTLYKRDGNVYR